MTQGIVQLYCSGMTENAWIVTPPAPALCGSDQFIGTEARVVDFWRFAMSDLRMNNTRGYLAEFLVANALGLQDAKRVEWDAYDLLLDDIRIEVKSSAYMQAWEQPRPSRITFSGLRGTRYHPRHGYDPSGKRLNAHIYVFCVQTSMSHEYYNPLDLGQWSFYVVKRSALEIQATSSIGLERVIHLAEGPTEWANLRTSVRERAAGEDIDESLWWS